MEQLSLPLFEPKPCDARPASSRRSTNGGGSAAATVSPPVARGRSRLSTNEKAPAPSNAPALLTTREVADALHVHPRTVQRLVERGQLSAVHLGTAVRFDPADIADLTDRLKRRASGLTPSTTVVVERSRAGGVSFAERLRSTQDEHRAAYA
jgi:excisionase family DNA binding protein